MGFEVNQRPAAERIVPTEVVTTGDTSRDQLEAPTRLPQNLNIYSRPAPKEIMDILEQAQGLVALDVTNDPASFGKARDQLYNVLEQLSLMLAREENKAKHDRFRAKIQKLQEHVNSLRAAAEKQLEAGDEEVDAVRQRSGTQLGFTLLAVLIVVATIAATFFFPPAAAAGAAAAKTSTMAAAGAVGGKLGAGVALSGAATLGGGAVGELVAADDIAAKHEHQSLSSELNAFATELQKLMETEGELEGEAGELLRKLLNTLLKIAEQLTAVRSKQAESL